MSTPQEFISDNYIHAKELIPHARKKWRRVVNEYKNRQCVICGEYVENITKEHIPPNAFFPKKPTNPVTVPSCKNCQDTPDDDFGELMSFLSVTRGKTHSSSARADKAIKRLNRKGNGAMSKAYERSLIKAYRGEIKIPDPYSEEFEVANLPAIEFPEEILYPVILKIVHGYYWLLTEGRVLSEKSGIIGVLDVTHGMRENFHNLAKDPNPSVNISGSQFVLTHLREDGEILTMGLHFHSNNNIFKGVHILIYICLDGVAGKQSKGKELKKLITESFMSFSTTDKIYDLPTLLTS